MNSPFWTFFIWMMRALRLITSSNEFSGYLWQFNSSSVSPYSNLPILTISNENDSSKKIEYEFANVTGIPGNIFFNVNIFSNCILFNSLSKMFAADMWLIMYITFKNLNTSSCFNASYSYSLRPNLFIPVSNLMTQFNFLEIFFAVWTQNSISWSVLKTGIKWSSSKIIFSHSLSVTHDDKMKIFTSFFPIFSALFLITSASSIYVTK